MINERITSKQHLPALWSMKMNNFILFKKWHHIPFKKEEGTHAIGEAVEGFGYLNQNKSQH